MNMRYCCYAPRGVFVLSVGTILTPLNPYSAKCYFDDGDYFDNENYDNSKFYDLALEAAEDIFTSCSSCVVDEFLCSVEDKEFNDTYATIVDVYKELGRNVPLGIRAAAALPHLWDIFCGMVADELELMCEYAEEFDDDEENEDDD